VRKLEKRTVLGWGEFYTKEWRRGIEKRGELV
jgi:hypothetical protein